MDFEGIISSEISQRKTTMTDIMCMISLVCGIQKIKQTSEYNKKEAVSQIQRTKEWLSVGKGKQRGAMWG